MLRGVTVADHLGGSTAVCRFRPNAVSERTNGPGLGGVGRPTTALRLALTRGLALDNT